MNIDPIVLRSRAGSGRVLLKLVGVVGARLSEPAAEFAVVAASVSRESPLFAWGRNVLELELGLSESLRAKIRAIGLRPILFPELERAGDLQVALALGKLAERAGIGLRMAA